MILIITNKEDVHPTPVIEALNKRGAAFFRLNTESLLTDYEFCWWNDTDGCDFRIKCRLNGLEIKGSEITAVWERRPEPPKGLPVKSSPQIDRHNLAEALGFLVFLRYYIKDIPSVGSIVGDRPAASKMLQYKFAIQVGFSVPESRYSNSKKDIEDLARLHKSLLLKSIESNDVWDDEKQEDYVFYAQRVSSEAVKKAPQEAFSQTVSFVQNYIEKDFELRVTVVGDRVFACKIDSQSMSEDTGKIDWRQGYEHGLKCEPFTLPDNISVMCIEYLHLMELSFGCFDFVVTPEGKYIFLECNPNGQWLWAEIATGQKISEAIADFLTKC